MGLVTAGKGVRGQHWNFPGPNSLWPVMKPGPKGGTPAIRTADGSTKKSNSRPQATPKTPPGPEGKGNGTDAAGEGTRDQGNRVARQRSGIGTKQKAGLHEPPAQIGTATSGSEKEINIPRPHHQQGNVFRDTHSFNADLAS